jgi:hypothetical protein
VNAPATSGSSPGARRNLVGITAICVLGEHRDCPDAKKDSYVCDCPCHLKENIMDNSSLGLKVWLLFVYSGEGKNVVSVVPFASEENLKQHMEELKAKKPHLTFTYDPRPDIVL